MENQRFKLDQLIRERKPGPLRLFKRNKAIQSQRKTLRLLITEAQQTIFGKEHHFNELLKADELEHAFQSVPISSYMEMKPYWNRAYQGEKDVCWSGGIDYFALSSGTTDATSKYIPVSDRMLKNIKRASVRQLFHIAKTDLPKDYLTKNYLFVGGSTDLEFNGNNFSGDLSGITTSNIPVWMRRFSKPEPHIRNQKEWDHKINMMVEQAPNWDIAMIAGVPAWIQLLFESIIKTYQLKTIHDIWPHLCVYVHGGVSFQPYKQSFEKYLAKPLKYFETYLASEGFIAFQVREQDHGMRLIFRNGVYYEFIPFNSRNFDSNGDVKEDAHVINVSEIEKNVDYAIVISTCSGAWRYILGDTIRFVNTDKFEIIITGRTKHFLSLCGEHLSVENMNAAITSLADELKHEISEFTVKGTIENGKYGHHWYLACDANLENTLVRNRLDELLQKSNDDYRVERKFALSNIQVTILPKSTFIGWMENRGKIGAQNKFPRVMNDQLYVSWVKYVTNASISSEVLT